MKTRLRVAVVGYGTGGQATALMLALDGHAVEVFERVPVPGPVGAGFLLQPVGLRVLHELGLLDAALAHGVPITRLYGETVQGRPVMDVRYAELDARYFGLGMQRGTLFQLLDTAWRDGRVIHCGRAIVDVDPGTGVLTDASGRTCGGFDLVVIADGAGSGLRGRVASARLDRAYPWGAQWCLVDQDDWTPDGQLQQRYLGARRMVGMLPVGTRPDDPVPRLSFFWSLSPAELERPDAEASRWRSEVAAVWPRAAGRLKDTPIPQALAVARYRDTVHRGWYRGLTVLLGDAAHAMSPQLGQGVNMALLDALALRDHLRAASSVAQALAGYQRERRGHVGIYHFWSRWLTPLFQSERNFAAAARDALFHPLSRMPVARGQMLRVLTGTRRGWFGKVRFSDGFLQALDSVPAAGTGDRMP